MDSTALKYKPMYESKLDPFSQFKQQETQSKSLNPAERVAMLVTKLLIGNKYSRIVFVLYSMMLHCLVVFAVYEVMSLEGCNETKFGKTTPDTIGK
jgi:homeobox protein cut-like